RSRLTKSAAKKNGAARCLLRLLVGVDPVCLMGTQMKKGIVLAAVMLLFGFGQLFSAGPAGNGRGEELAAAGPKVGGTGEGQGGCDGRLVFQANGTYELSDYGPGGCNSKGTWKVRWDTLPATLTLTCKTSDVQEDVGKTTEVTLIKLDDTTLAIEHANRN